MCTITTTGVVFGYGAHSPVTVSKQGARPRSLAPTVAQDDHYLVLFFALHNMVDPSNSIYIFTPLTASQSVRRSTWNM